MNFSIIKQSKKLFCGALLTISCLGMSTVCFAEAKAFELGAVLKGSYVHTMCNEFFQRGADIYNSDCGWGEITIREESGMDGSVTRSWLIGDVKQDEKDFALFVKRHVIQKLDNCGNILMHKIKDVNYKIKLYHRMENGFKAEWIKKGQKPCADIDGEYIASMEFPVMSSEAAMYVLERYMNSIPVYKKKLQGAAMVHTGAKLAENHTIKLIEQYPEHVVIRGVYYITAAGTIAEYDAANDKWIELVH